MREQIVACARRSGKKFDRYVRKRPVRLGLADADNTCAAFAGKFASGLRGDKEPFIVGINAEGTENHSVRRDIDGHGSFGPKRRFERKFRIVADGRSSGDANQVGQRNAWMASAVIARRAPG